jgi:hypothetical protein
MIPKQVALEQQVIRMGGFSGGLHVLVCQCTVGVIIMVVIGIVIKGWFMWWIVRDYRIGRRVNGISVLYESEDETAIRVE